MHFDDRLATVLRHRATGMRAARTQYRQLLDLLGQPKRAGDQSLLAAAWLRLGALGETIPAVERAAIVREPSWRFQNPELAAHLAEDEPAVAAAALGSAFLAEDDWEALIPRLPVRARGFLRLRRDLPAGAVRVLDRLGVSDRALPLPQADEPLVLSEELPDTVEDQDQDRASERVVMPFPANDRDTPAKAVPAAPEPAETPDPVTAEHSEEREQSEDTSSKTATPIAALVERIEAFQRTRSEAKRPVEDRDAHPPLPFVELQDNDEDLREDGLVITTDAEGRVDWAEEHIAPMLRYMVLAQGLGRADQIAMQQRQPLAAAPITLEGAPRIAGQWILDASPRFDPIGGRFIGYAARLRRPSARQEDEDSPESDRIRQLLHELRTPVNAIQGFAEVIQQQLFGPVPHEYRALAASIAGDAARMLAGFDELDRLAKLESRAREMETGTTDFSSVVDRQLKQLAAILQPRNASFAAELDSDCLVGLAETDAEALSWRMLAALAAAMAPNETASLALQLRSEALQLTCTLPSNLQSREDIFAAETQKGGSSGMLTPGSFGSGFALRLARAEARASGGGLARVDDTLVLTLPLLTAVEADSSAEEGSDEETARPRVS